MEAETKIIKELCRKCGEEYYYDNQHLEDDRCGSDICHICIHRRRHW